MSTMTRITAVAFAVLTAGAFVLLSSTESQARSHCHWSGGRPVCVNTPNGYDSSKCAFLPTVSNGRVNGLRKVCF